MRMKALIVPALALALAVGGSSCGSTTVVVLPDNSGSKPPSSGGSGRSGGSSYGSGGSSRSSGGYSTTTRSYGYAGGSGSRNAAESFEPVGKPQ